MHLIKVACNEMFKFKLDTSVERITSTIHKVFLYIAEKVNFFNSVFIILKGCEDLSHPS